MCEKKVCTKCEIEKPLDEFCNHKGKSDGKTSRCKSCIKEDKKNYYDENRDKVKIRNKKWREKNPDIIKKTSKKWREKNPDKVKEFYKTYREENSDKIINYKKRYREENRDKIKASRRKYYEENRDKVLEDSKKYREENSDKIINYKKRYREENLDKIKVSSKKYYEENRDKVLEGCKTYREENSDKVKESNKKYYEENRDKVLEGCKIYMKRKRHEDPLFKLSCNIRTAISKSYKRKGWRKTSKSQELLGCNFSTLEKHLNNNPYGFKVGMKGLDLDHIVPISKATTEEDVFELNHYNNFQLLPSDYNRHVKIDSEWDREHFENWLSENYSW
jgi:hypothetical protein